MITFSISISDAAKAMEGLELYFTGYKYIQKVYTSLGISSMQIILLSAHACMHFA